jgi:integrase
MPRRSHERLKLQSVMITLPGSHRRVRLRLGRVHEDLHHEYRSRIRELQADVTARRPSHPQLIEWVTRLPERHRKALERWGLITGYGQADMTLGKFLAEHFANLHVKPGTIVHYGQTRKELETFFGPGKLLRDIVPLDGDKFRTFLITRKLSPATVNRRVGVARQLFGKAVDAGYLRDNPFRKLKVGSQANPKRQHFITHEVAERVLGSMFDPEWRLIFALSRYGGLRCPSEHLQLTWDDINWEAKKIWVRSPKTEHHAGGEGRWVPLFWELERYLLECYHAAPEGSKHVITRYRSSNTNLRTQLLRHLKRAGVDAWPKLFHNLRSTRQTELEETFPAGQVCKWMGNSPKIADRHYRQTQDHLFIAAATRPEAAQKAAQQGAESSGMAYTCDREKSENPPVLPRDSEQCHDVPEDGDGRYRIRTCDPQRVMLVR